MSPRTPNPARRLDATVVTRQMCPPGSLLSPRLTPRPSTTTDTTAGAPHSLNSETKELSRASRLTLGSVSLQCCSQHARQGQRIYSKPCPPPLTTPSFLHHHALPILSVFPCRFSFIYFFPTSDPNCKKKKSNKKNTQFLFLSCSRNRAVCEG